MIMHKLLVKREREREREFVSACVCEVVGREKKSVVDERNVKMQKVNNSNPSRVVT